MTDKIIRGAGTHKVLIALCAGDKGSKELKKIVGAINSISRFDGEYMSRLEINGYVIKVGDLWCITTHGRQKCDAIGPLTPRNRTPSRGGMRIMEMETLASSPEPIRRPGSMDYRNFPSRRGGRLYYPDGRVENLEEDLNG